MACVNQSSSWELQCKKISAPSCITVSGAVQLGSFHCWRHHRNAAFVEFLNCSISRLPFIDRLLRRQLYIERYDTDACAAMICLQGHQSRGQSKHFAEQPTSSCMMQAIEGLQNGHQREVAFAQVSCFLTPVIMVGPRHFLWIVQ